MKEEIIVTIKKGGEIHAEARGVKGKQCIEITEFISALGESTRSLKSEYFQSENTKISPRLTVRRGHNTVDETA